MRFEGIVDGGGSKVVPLQGGPPAGWTGDETMATIVTTSQYALVSPTIKGRDKLC